MSLQYHFLKTGPSSSTGLKIVVAFVNMETFKPIFSGLLIKDHSFYLSFIVITATLGNTLILIALHKVSSIHPPTNRAKSFIYLSLRKY